MIAESDIPRWVWEGLKEMWSKIKSPDDPNMDRDCAMCYYILEVRGGICPIDCPIAETYCSRDNSIGILDAYGRPVGEWTRNVAAFNRYIEERLEETQ